MSSARKIAMIIIAVLVLLGIGALGAWPRIGWLLAKRMIDEDVPTVSTAQLAARLERDPRPLLLDVREADEFAVSHLPGAIHFPPGAPIDDAIRSAPAVVAYCSVGVRSAAEVARLRADGIENAENLEGSIFRWAEEGRDLVDGEGETNVVHPFDRLWGRLLPARLRAWEPR